MARRSARPRLIEHEPGAVAGEVSLVATSGLEGRGAREISTGNHRLPGRTRPTIGPRWTVRQGREEGVGVPSSASRTSESSTGTNDSTLALVEGMRPTCRWRIPAAANARSDNANSSAEP